jgi:serine/threonine-protein kinase RsbW
MPPTAEPGTRLALSVPARIDVLESCRRAVLDFLAPHGLGPQVIYSVELVLEETLVNAISYGYADAREHTIELSVEVEPARVVLAFEDDGVEFDPRRSGEAPTAAVTIDNAPSGGRGLLLVRNAACAIDYARAGGRNRLTIGVARG